MSSTTETGHAKNLANYDELVDSIGGLGSKYGPSKANLALDIMKVVSTDCRDALNNVMKARAAYKNAVDARETIFLAISKLITRIMSTLKASDVSSGAIKTCASIVRKIQGRRATRKRTVEEANADKEAGIDYREISASQQSFDNVTENFSMFVEQLISIPGYKPNEQELQTESLNRLIAEARKKNAEVVSSRIALQNARTVRDELMYKEGTGLVSVAKDVKAYIKGAFGPSSAEYRKIAGLEFRKN